MKVHIGRNSGAGGQISSLLPARTDLAKQQTADRKLVNVIPLPEGARTRLPGTRMVAPLKDETRPVAFITFDADAGDSYLLAFNGGVMRVFRDNPVTTDGTTPYELAHPFLDADLANLSAAQSIDVIFIASGKRPKRLTRVPGSDTNWVLEDYPYVQGPVQIQNTNKGATITASGETGTVTMTASTPVFQAGHVGSVWRLDEQDYSNPAEWKAFETPITLGARRRYKSKIYEVVALNVTAPTPGDTGPNAPTHDDGDFYSAGSAVTWRFISYSYAYVKITGYTSPTSVTAQVIGRLPASIVSSGTYRWSEAAWSDVRGWPTAVSIVDQSLVWLKGNTAYQSSTLDIYSFEITADGDGGQEFSLFAPDGKRVNAQWTMPAGVIVIGGSSHEFIVRGASNIYDKLNSTNARAIPQGTKGSVRQIPAYVEGGVVFIGKSRRKLNFARFDPALEQVAFKEFTTYSREMLRGGAQQVVAQSDPYNQIFVRMTDGTISSCTFLPEEDVLGWARHPRPNFKALQLGARQSDDGSYSQLWLCVERVINGQTRRFIEVMQPYFIAQDPDNPTAVGAWFLDCAKRYDGPATSTITGLSHLEGQTVGVFANGQQFLDRVVSGGSITIERPMTGVIVGLKIPYLIKSLPFEIDSPSGPSIGMRKASAKVHLWLFETAGGQIANADTPGTPLYESGGAPLGSPLELLNDIHSYQIEPATTQQLTLELSGDDALPTTLLGWWPEMEIRN